MSTIRDALKHYLEPVYIKTTAVKDENGLEYNSVEHVPAGTEGATASLAYPIPEFVMSMALVISLFAGNLLTQDLPIMAFKGQDFTRKTYKSINDVDLGSIIKILTREDIFLSVQAFRQVHSFMEWLMEQEVPGRDDEEPDESTDIDADRDLDIDELDGMDDTDDGESFDDFLSWDSPEYLAVKWNEYVALQADGE